MSNQDIEGNAPADEARGAPAGTPAGAPAGLEQELAKERDARVLMRDRLRHTEALAAESHALRSRMADELARVTADRDRLRTAAASGSGAGAGTGTGSSASAGAGAGAGAGSSLEETVPLRGMATPAFTPRATDWPPKSPAPAPRRRAGPWGALAMLGCVAAVGGAVAWFSGSLPGHSPDARDTSRDDTALSAPAALASSAPGERVEGIEHVAPPAADTVLAGGAPPAANVPSGAVALPPLTPAAQLAAAPTAAGSEPAASPSAQVSLAAPAAAAAPAGIATRLRKALDGEGISAPVDVDAVSGQVMVADPQSDSALRDRTDMLIRAVYAGASLPEPQIEHRWISTRRASRAVPAADAAPARPRASTASTSTMTSSNMPGMTPAQAYAARHAQPQAQAQAQDRGVDHRARTAAPGTVVEAEELRPVLPEGRVTASCRAGLAGRTPHRADMTACMKSSCCRTGNGQAEDCRAYQKAYPFACSAG